MFVCHRWCASCWGSSSESASSAGNHISPPAVVHAIPPVPPALHTSPVNISACQPIFLPTCMLLRCRLTQAAGKHTRRDVVSAAAVLVSTLPRLPIESVLEERRTKPACPRGHLACSPATTALKNWHCGAVVEVGELCWAHRG